MASGVNARASDLGLAATTASVSVFLTEHLAVCRCLERPLVVGKYHMIKRLDYVSGVRRERDDVNVFLEEFKDDGDGEV
jgi:hypothetical protein